MDKNAIWKWLALILLVTLSLWTITPASKKIRYGLDLKGGTSFTVNIDKKKLREDALTKVSDVNDTTAVDAIVKKATKDAQPRVLEVLRNRIDKLGIAEPVIYPGKDGRIIIQLPGVDDKKRKEAEQSIKSSAYLEFRLVHKDNDNLSSKLFQKQLAPKGYQIVAVDGRSYYKKSADYGKLSKSEGYFTKLGEFHTPDTAYEFMLEKKKIGDQDFYSPIFVKRRAEMSGDMLSDASVDYRAMGQPIVRIVFDGQGQRDFAKVTENYAPYGPRNLNNSVGRQLAIVLDGTLYSAPAINEKITGGRGEISGSFTPSEAIFLANILKAGSLPAPVEILEARSVEPSLGKDSIDSGFKAIEYGAIIVVVFMAVYYLLSGLIANIALLLNMILLPLGMIAVAGFLSLGLSNTSGGGPIKLPVLTLPGIAGILLTIGMAVDANVLIFERIREECRHGKAAWTSISAGYDRAFVTIVDANLTTLLTGIILFRFGSGPIRGFAVTLCAGIIVSMYTALFVTKLIFSSIAPKLSLKSLKMFSIVGKTAVDFVGKRKIAIAISLFVIIASWVMLINTGIKNPSKLFGVDFTGGTAITFQFDQKVPVDEVRSALTDAGLKDAQIQYQAQTLGAEQKEFMLVRTGAGDQGGIKTDEYVKNTLSKSFPDAKYVGIQTDTVGSQIGGELKRSAVLSIILALCGIIIYISWRFELGFAIGAIVALAHDVLITLGIYTMMGQQISLPIVAALLTIVGYSVNDTIVVFDRIREDLKLVKNKSFKEICNLSINQTLSRTLLTSATTMLVVLSLLVVGGGAIYDFALALFIGVMVGTYSSIFIATPVVLMWHHNKKPELSVKSA